MARKKKPEKHANHERWLVSYADFITLLFAVFVTLYAMSQTDKKKVDMVAASYRSAFGITTGAGGSSSNILNGSDIIPIPSLQIVPTPPKNEDASDAGRNPQTQSGDSQNINKSIIMALKPLQLAGMVFVEETSRGLAIRLDEEIFFESGSANIKKEALPLIGRIAGAISSSSNQQLRIEGHTDNQPVATTRYTSNWELSLDRAANVVRIFLENYDFSPANISLAGHGQYRPIASNDNEAGRKRNRRIDIILLESKADRPQL